MDYELILKDIKPTAEEKQHVDDVSSKLMNFLQKTCDENGIDAKVTLVGSVAKNTALKGKSDIKTLHLKESLTLISSSLFL